MIKVNTCTMPNSVDERVLGVLTNVMDNTESYPQLSEYKHDLMILQDKIGYGYNYIDQGEFELLKKAFQAYYSEDSLRVKALQKWWNSEVSKQVLSELGD